MTAIAKALLNAIPAISFDVENFEAIALFCGAGLLVSLCLAFSGLEVNYGMF
ncbi:MAG TPA: hypothetical protein VHM22_06125 [Bradyrhizobium sp.]|jgi:hypothetical protein|uniref:hypothetical protein n=1 Tax=Bradyrhizobium sp. TaxID=376 RepID=UPI002B490BB9|nr:hypothetical protein [Bradyrhizobium sp.]HEX2632362.1 hypothetical protein [Bradyrhizobium sp.]HKO73468.1 hypothetical protein [Bradyrhizobium sp.]